MLLVPLSVLLNLSVRLQINGTRQGVVGTKRGRDEEEMKVPARALKRFATQRDEDAIRRMVAMAVYPFGFLVFLPDLLLLLIFGECSCWVLGVGNDDERSEDREKY